MSSGGFTTIVNDHPDLAEEIRKLQNYLSGIEVNQFFTAEQAASFLMMNSANVRSLLDLIESHEFIQSDSVFWCENCSQPAELDESGKATCDLCFDVTEVRREGYRLLRKVQKVRPWYSDYKGFSQYSDFQRKFLDGVPRFIHSLQVAPPLFLRNAVERGQSVQEHDFRDEMQRAVSFMCGADGEVSRRSGRCDLILRESSNDLRSIVGEFKVWPRNDYKDVIDQLLGYFTDFEELGFVFMVNENKMAIGERYKEEIISTNRVLVPESLTNAPIVRSIAQFEHYLSLHSLSTGRHVKVFHFIFNVHSGAQN